MKRHKPLLEKINSRKAVIGVIGLGYVGLPLAVLLAKKGYNVKGFLRSEDRAKKLNKGKSNIEDIQDRELKKVIKADRFEARQISANGMRECDIFLICVPTPVNVKKEPDLSALKSVAERVSELKLDGKLIINESTVAPSTTTEIFGKLGGNYFLACSPERINPGDGRHTIENIPKVIGGRDTESRVLAAALYKNVVQADVVEVGSLKAAEMTKMVENTYRAVNIALSNELALLCEKTGIDVLEVIRAADSKWSYHPHYPGIGVGGHCIPVDPYYLLRSARQHGIELKTVEESLARNEKMPEHMLKKFLAVYEDWMSVLVYGLSYKRDIADLRESPAIEFCRLLQENNIDFKVYDPFIHTDIIVKELKIKQTEFPEMVDILVVGTDHNKLKYDYKKVVGENTIILDGRNYFKEKVGEKVIGVGRLLEN